MLNLDIPVYCTTLIQKLYFKYLSQEKTCFFYYYNQVVPTYRPIATESILCFFFLFLRQGPTIYPCLAGLELKIHHFCLTPCYWDLKVYATMSSLSLFCREKVITVAIVNNILILLKSPDIYFGLVLSQIM